MPATDTVDIVTVVSGEVWLAVEDGAKVALGPGDRVVQNGARHARRNRTAEPCAMAAVVVGARREG